MFQKNKQWEELFLSNCLASSFVFHKQVEDQNTCIYKKFKDKFRDKGAKNQNQFICLNFTKCMWEQETIEEEEEEKEEFH